MRPQQQNRRMRGRNNNGGGGGGNNGNNNNNRKGPNPLTRNYESNGPDVKIRGSAQQIAEKYTTLARDAHSSGDRVMAENYLQHAEHYNRIIAAAQAQMPIQQAQSMRDDNDDDQDDDRDDFDSMGNGNGNANGNGGNHGRHNEAQSVSQAPVNDGSGPQPVIEGTPAEVALNSEPVQHAPRPRHRERRPQMPPLAPAVNAEPAAAGEPEAAAQPQAGEAEGAEAAAPRRGRRPRRGERRPDETASEADAAPSGEAPAADPALASVEN